MAEAIKSERAVEGCAAIDDDPLPDPVHGFTLQAFNERVTIGG
jgi:hypothetical protein